MQWIFLFVMLLYPNAFIKMFFLSFYVRVRFPNNRNRMTSSQCNCSAILIFFVLFLIYKQFMNMDWRERVGIENLFFIDGMHTTGESDFVPSFKTEVAKVSKRRRGWKSSGEDGGPPCSWLPAHWSLWPSASKVTQAKSEHKKLFLPALVKSPHP